jgi:hypothetical protein
MRKRAIPSPGQVADPHAARMLSAIKENIEVITGGVGGEINTLAASATLADVIAKVNEIIRRINRSGT